MDERALAGAGDAGDAAENAERNVDVDVAKIVVSDAAHFRVAFALRRCVGTGMDFLPER